MRNASRSVTIHDLARQLHVSSTTVWRALNENTRVSPKTRQRVIKAARQCNYRPSLVAQTLSRGRTRTLGVVVPMIGNPVHASLVRAVEQVAFEREYSVILCDTDFRLPREQRHLDLLLRRRVEGLAIVAFADRQVEDFGHLLALAQRGVRVVAMQSAVPEARLDSVVPDNEGAAASMTRHLIGLGHRRIGFLHAGLESWNAPMLERLAGYRGALESAGIGLEQGLVMQAAPFESVMSEGPSGLWGEKVTEYLLRPDGPTAVFAPLDVLAIKVIRAAQSAGLRVPQDLAVAGFDDILMSGYLNPPLTTVRHPAERVGRRAAELIFERLADSSGAAPVRERVPCELIVRRSCGNGASGREGLTA